MTRRATVLQPDGMLRDKNPANREALRKHFGDGKWRTAYDMGVTLHARGVIPDCIAIRAMSRSPKVLRRHVADQIRAGCRALVRESINAAVAAGVFESRGKGEKREYRCIQPQRSRPRVGSELSEAELKAAAAATRYGISHAHVYQLIKEHPKIEPKDLIPHLLSKMIDEAILARYTAEKIRRILEKAKASTKTEKRKAAEERVTRERRDDEDKFLADARLFTVSEIINDMVGKKKVTSESRRTLSVAEG
jgi:hypothetical protein